MNSENKKYHWIRGRTYPVRPLNQSEVSKGMANKLVGDLKEHLTFEVSVKHAMNNGLLNKAPQATNN